MPVPWQESERSCKCIQCVLKGIDFVNISTISDYISKLFLQSGIFRVCILFMHDRIPYGARLNPAFHESFCIALTGSIPTHLCYRIKPRSGLSSDSVMVSSVIRCSKFNKVDVEYCCVCSYCRVELICF